MNQFNETATRDHKIQAWYEARKTLTDAKAIELQLRNEVLAECFGYEEDGREGTENLELANNYKLKAQFKLNRKLENGDNEVDKVLSAMERSQEGRIYAERLINFKPELSVSEYKKLPDEFKKMVDQIIVAKPGTASLTLVPPKSKR